MSELQAIVSLAGSHLWQSVLVAGALALILIMGRRMSGKARYGLACAAMAAGLILPLAAFAPGGGAMPALLSMLKAPVKVAAPADTTGVRVAVTPAGEFSAGLAAAPASDRISDIGTMPISTRTEAPAMPVFGRPIVPIAEAALAKGVRLPDFRLPQLPDLRLPFLVIWIAGALTLLVRLAIDLIAVEKLVARARPLTLSPELARRLGAIRIAISPDAPGPMAAGLLHPTVVLPENIGERIHSPEMAALLEHELAHLERRDVLAALAQRILLALAWWSPAMHWISRRIDEERETACDETAVERTGDARAFARALTSQAEAQLWAHAPRLAVGAIGRRSQFGRRIKRLIEIAKAGGSPKRYSGRLAFTGLALAVAVAAVVTPKIALAEPNRADPPKAGHSKSGPIDITKPQDADASGKGGEAALEGAAAEGKSWSDAGKPFEPADVSKADDLGLDIDSLVSDVTTAVQQAMNEAKPSITQDAAKTGLDFADFGLEIADLVDQQVLSQLPGVMDDVRTKLEAKGIDIDDPDSLTAEQRAHIAAEMAKLQAKLKAEFGPEFQAKLKAEIDHAQGEIQRSRAEIYRSAQAGAVAMQQNKAAMEAARQAIARAKEEIEAAKARGDFKFSFSFDDGDLTRIRDQAKSGAFAISISQEDQDFREAVEDGESSTVRRLIEKKGANPNQIFPGKGSALMIAVSDGESEMAKVLLEHGANPNAGGPGLEPPLVRAAKDGEDSLVRLLLQHGADPNAHAPDGETALIEAACDGEDEIARTLADHKADVNLAAKIHGRMMTPLSVAIKAGEGDIARMLRNHGAKDEPGAGH